jgi:hypothetical protein
MEKMPVNFITGFFKINFENNPIFSSFEPHEGFHSGKPHHPLCISPEQTHIETH